MAHMINWMGVTIKPKSLRFKLRAAKPIYIPIKKFSFEVKRHVWWWWAELKILNVWSSLDLTHNKKLWKPNIKGSNFWLMMIIRNIKHHSFNPTQFGKGLGSTTWTLLAPLSVAPMPAPTCNGQWPNQRCNGHFLRRCDKCLNNNSKWHDS